MLPSGLDNGVHLTITDGAMDGGIDAVHIVGNNVHIFNFKYTEQWGKISNHFPGGEIDRLLVTTSQIFNKTLTKRDVNAALWEKVQEIWQAFEQGRLNFIYYLCSNMQKPIAHIQRKLETALKQYLFASVQYIDQDDFVTRLLERKLRKVNGRIKFLGKEYFQRSDGGLKGVVATVSIVELIQLVQDPERVEDINEDVFDENVRGFLKLRNRVNRRIYETAVSDENYKFWYLNNGITIVCEKLDYNPVQDSPTVSLTNLQIVNGGQTTHALFEAYKADEDRVSGIKVLIRICETNNRQISNKISETTNSQTPVSTRDLHANDFVQRKLEEAFEALGYYYERKKNQHEDEPKEQRLDSELLGQLYLAYYLDMPSEAKNTKTLVFDQKYDEIFDESKTTASDMLLAYKIYLPLERMKAEIQKKKRRREPIDERDAFVSRATFHLLNSVKYIAEKESLNLNDAAQMNDAIEKAIEYVEEVTRSERERRGEAYSHDKLFKEVRTNNLIRQHILGKNHD